MSAHQPESMAAAYPLRKPFGNLTQQWMIPELTNESDGGQDRTWGFGILYIVYMNMQITHIL
jgi:hypothetical protein